MNARLVAISTLIFGLMPMTGVDVDMSLAKGQSAKQIVNLVPNPSFEEADGEDPRGWETKVWSKTQEFCLFEYQSPSEVHTGSLSVAITSDGGVDASWTTNVKVIPNSRYRFSGWIKTQNVEAGSGEGALFNLHGMPAKTRALTGTRDWTRVAMEFESGDLESVQLNCLFGGWGRSTGKAWFDDLRLEFVSAVKQISVADLKPEVSINASKEEGEISKYIYGQFIEHLGRCIYGGIWAEMLEDRKFYYPVPAKSEIWTKTRAQAEVLAASPWQLIGEGDVVTMIKENSFVGEQTPQINLPVGRQVAGIFQEGLGILKGKAYTGRIVIAGDPKAAPIRVRLAWGKKNSNREAHDEIIIKKIGKEFKTILFRFKAGASTNNARLEIVGLGEGSFQIGTVSLMPADNIGGWRADTVKLLKELDSPVYRWPGGNFVSGYDWKDGLGDPDRRPPRKNPAWTGVEHNDVGLHEFMFLCREIKTEPFIAVNTGLGSVEDVREEVEYCNGSLSTPMGKWRAENGDAEPFEVKWWAVGNEMYGNWQLGHMSLSDYVVKHNKCADAMRSVDPSIQLIGVGALGPWSKQMLTDCADHMELISEHFYCKEKKILPLHVAQIPERVKLKADAHREYRKTIDSLKGKDIRIAMDEWNYWYGPHEFGELGTRYFLKDALGIARGLHEFFRNSDIIFMANYAQTVNVIGCIKTNKTSAAFETTGLVLKLYRKHYGVYPVEVTGAPEPLDVVAAWTEDRKTLTVGIVNPTRIAKTLDLDLQGASLQAKGEKFLITGSDPQAYNDPGAEPAIRIVETSVKDLPTKLKVPPMSVTLYSLKQK